MINESRTAVERWAEHHWPGTLVELVIDHDDIGFIAKFELEQGRITIIGAPILGLGVCTDTEAHAASLQGAFAIKQLAQLFGGDYSVTCRNELDH